MKLPMLRLSNARTRIDHFRKDEDSAHGLFERQWTQDDRETANSGRSGIGFAVSLRNEKPHEPHARGPAASRRILIILAEAFLEFIG